MKNKLLVVACLMLVLFSCQTKNTLPDKKSVFQKDLLLKNHSWANYDEVVADSLHLDIHLNFDKQQIAGVAEWHINVPDSIGFWKVDARLLHIEEITVSGKKTRFLTSDTHAVFGTGVAIPVKPGSQVVQIRYRTSTEAPALQWLDTSQSRSRFPFLYTQSQAILARSWVPCMDHPAQRFRYSAKVSVPKGMMALMSASNPQQKSEDGVYTFHMEQAIPSYLMALAAGELEFGALDSISGIYARPDLLSSLLGEFHQLPQMISAAGKLYGQYAWGRYDVLFLPASFPFGGMENPRLTFATPTIIAGDGSLSALLAHELAHSWSGNLVTNHSWDDFWLNEGFTVYFEQRIMERVYGKDYADMLTVLGWGDLQHTLDEMGHDHPDTRLALDLYGRDPDDAVSDIAYEKGRFFLQHIESVVGRERFDTFLHAYFTAFAFKTGTTAKFLDFLEKNLIRGDKKTGEAIDAGNWIFQPGLPTYVKAPESSAFDGVDAIRKRVLQQPALTKHLTDNWTTHHYLHFLRSLGPADAASFKGLDEVFHFSQSPNAEISAIWLQRSLEVGYKPAEPYLEQFLARVGRRKFLMPLYTAFSGKYPQRALEVYKQNRSRYHAVSIKSLDELLLK